MYLIFIVLLHGYYKWQILPILIFQFSILAGTDPIPIFGKSIWHTNHRLLGTTAKCQFILMRSNIGTCIQKYSNSNSVPFAWCMGQ